MIDEQGLRELMDYPDAHLMPASSAAVLAIGRRRRRRRTAAAAGTALAIAGAGVVAVQGLSGPSALLYAEGDESRPPAVTAQAFAETVQDFFRTGDYRAVDEQMCAETRRDEERVPFATQLGGRAFPDATLTVGGPSAGYVKDRMGLGGDAEVYDATLRLVPDDVDLFAVARQGDGWCLSTAPGRVSSASGYARLQNQMQALPGIPFAVPIVLPDGWRLASSGDTFGPPRAVDARTLEFVRDRSGSTEIAFLCVEAADAASGCSPQSDAGSAVARRVGELRVAVTFNGGSESARADWSGTAFTTDLDAAAWLQAPTE